MAEQVQPQGEQQQEKKQPWMPDFGQGYIDNFQRFDSMLGRTATGQLALERSRLSNSQQSLGLRAGEMELEEYKNRVSEERQRRGREENREIEDRNMLKSMLDRPSPMAIGGGIGAMDGGGRMVDLGTSIVEDTGAKVRRRIESNILRMQADLLKEELRTAQMLNQWRLEKGNPFVKRAN